MSWDFLFFITLFYTVIKLIYQHYLLYSCNEILVVFKFTVSMLFSEGTK